MQKDEQLFWHFGYYHAVVRFKLCLAYARTGHANPRPKGRGRN